ncbi:hypothetical protein ACHQM5_021996 [Ranunculus cassubicifolius]
MNVIESLPPFYLGQTEDPFPSEICNPEKGQQGNTANTSEIPKSYIASERNPHNQVGIRWCQICNFNVEHDESHCPDKEKNTGMACMYCYGPCRKNWQGEHGKNIARDMIITCAICGVMRDHWAPDCPIVSEMGNRDIDSILEEFDLDDF